MDGAAADVASGAAQDRLSKSVSPPTHDSGRGANAPADSRPVRGAAPHNGTVASIEVQLAHNKAEMKVATRNYDEAVENVTRLEKRRRVLTQQRTQLQQQLDERGAKKVEIGLPAGAGDSDPFDTLPDELLAAIVIHLPAQVVYGTIARLSQRWHKITVILFFFSATLS